MDKRSKKIYPSKDIIIAYVTTVNPDSYTIEGQLEKSVIALRKINYGNTELTPVDNYFPYYNVDKTIPITKKMEKVSSFITTTEINRIISKEKEIQKLLQPEIRQQNLHNIEENSKKIQEITNELSIEKVKKLVAKDIG